MFPQTLASWCQLIFCTVVVGGVKSLWYTDPEISSEVESMCFQPLYAPLNEYFYVLQDVSAGKR